MLQTKVLEMRQVITAKDIQLYFGKKPSMSFKMMSQIKKDLGKLKHQPVTIADFCQYYNVEQAGIEMIIKEIENNKLKSNIELIDSENQVEILESNEQSVVVYKTNDSYSFSKRTW